MTDYRTGHLPLFVLTALAASALLLAGCSGSSAPASSAAAETAVPAETEPVVTVITETTAPELVENVPAGNGDTETPPAPGMVRSALTHEWISETLAAKRPVAVMYPTDKAAQPQYGLNRAEVFYEIMEEGGISRQMGVIQDWEGLDRIGNIRSVRDYFIYEALEWDAVLVHFGGPEIFVKDLLNRADVDNLNGVGGVMGPAYDAFYRIPANSKSAHTAYTDGKHLAAAIEKAGFSAEHREKYWSEDHWKFASGSAPVDLGSHEGAVSAAEIDLAGCFPITKTTLRYDPGKKLYYRSIYGKAQKDGATGEQLAFTNVLIEAAVSGTRGGSQYMYFHVLDSMQDGWYLTGGKMIHVHWMKNTDYETTRFYDDSGEEITLNTGKTMVFITQAGKDTFTADGVKYDV